MTLLIYGVLTGTTIGVPWLMGRRWRRQDPAAADDEDARSPYGPPPEQRQKANA
jgi:hypothetical protein